jgi:hypothetical protein
MKEPLTFMTVAFYNTMKKAWKSTYKRKRPGMIERLKELNEKATGWPWVSRHGSDGICNEYLFKVIIDGDERDRMSPDDVRLIVEMRNALPKLLALVDAAENYFILHGGKFNPRYFPQIGVVVDALNALCEEKK